MPPLDLDELDMALRDNPSTLDPPCIAIDALPQLLRIARAAQKADELLEGMWSYNEEGRKQAAHTWYVQASDVLRAALEGR